MRLFRVYRNKALAYGDGWSLEKSFNASHYEAFLKSIDQEYADKCSHIVAGNIFSDEPNGRIFLSEHGPLITLCDSLSFFFKFGNLALMCLSDKVPDYIRVNALRIAVRVMLKTEALDFFMDPRGILPKDIAEEIHSMIPDQMLFIAGHEYSHYICDHISEQDTKIGQIFHAIFPGESDYHPVTVYNQSQKQEFEADIKSITLPKYSNGKRIQVMQAALMWFAALEIYEGVYDVISPPNPYGYLTHPSASDRYINLLENVPLPKKYNLKPWKEFRETIKSFKETLQEDVTLNIETYENYGSVYLDKPDSDWRGPELIDRVDYY